MTDTSGKIAKGTNREGDGAYMVRAKGSPETSTRSMNNAAHPESAIAEQVQDAQAKVGFDMVPGASAANGGKGPEISL